MSLDTRDEALVGDLAGAYRLLRSLIDDSAGRSVGEAGGTPSDGEHLLRGLGTVICIFMALFGPGELLEIRAEPDDEGSPPDALNAVVPAIVGRLRKMLPGAQEAMPMIAGALTAAALQMNCYEWRDKLGPWSAADKLAWAFAACELADLVDFAMVESQGRKGFALDMLARIVGEDVAK